MTELGMFENQMEAAGHHQLNSILQQNKHMHHDFKAFRKSHDFTGGGKKGNPLFIQAQARATSALALNADEIRSALGQTALMLPDSIKPVVENIRK